MTAEWISRLSFSYLIFLFLRQFILEHFIMQSAAHCIKISEREWLKKSTILVNNKKNKNMYNTRESVKVEKFQC